jgi:hypothetical protein
MLEIGETRTGLALAVPLCRPDGWQIVVELDELTPKAVRLTDRGRILQWLAGAGQNVEGPGFCSILNDRLRTFDLSRDAWEIYREVPLPLQGCDLLLFGEALLNIANLCNLHEPVVRTQNIAEQTVERVFADRQLHPQRNHTLSGLVETKVKVDFYLDDTTHPVAVQVLNRRGSVTSYMEQWGFRWRDLRDATPALLPAMIYDPATQEIDATAKAIGESVCEIFCPYHETEQLHQLLERAHGGN